MSGPGVPLGKDGIRPGDVPALALGSGLPGVASPDPRNTPAPPRQPLDRRSWIS